MVDSLAVQLGEGEEGSSPERVAALKTFATAVIELYKQNKGTQREAVMEDLFNGLVGKIKEVTMDAYQKEVASRQKKVVSLTRKLKAKTLLFKKRLMKNKKNPPKLNAALKEEKADEHKASTEEKAKRVVTEKTKRANEMPRKGFGPPSILSNPPLEKWRSFFEIFPRTNIKESGCTEMVDWMLRKNNCERRTEFGGCAGIYARFNAAVDATFPNNATKAKSFHVTESHQGVRYIRRMPFLCYKEHDLHVWFNTAHLQFNKTNSSFYKNHGISSIAMLNVRVRAAKAVVCLDKGAGRSCHSFKQCFPSFLNKKGAIADRRKGVSVCRTTEQAKLYNRKNPPRLSERTVGRCPDLPLPSVAEKEGIIWRDNTRKDPFLLEDFMGMKMEGTCANV